MTMLQWLTEFLIPLTGGLSLAAGLMSWQTSQRFWSGQLKPRRWETVDILAGAAVMAWYVAFQTSGPLSGLTVVIVVCSAAGVAWLGLRGSERRGRDSNSKP